MKRSLAVMLMVGLFVGLAPSPARACSCIAPDAEEMLGRADYAFVGSIVSVERLGQGQFGGEALFTFEVRGWAKGNLGETVSVVSADNGAACGYEIAPGNEAAIFLYKSDGRLTGGLCDTMGAADLEAVADLEAPAASEAPPPGDPGPVPDGRSPLPLVAASAAGVAAAALGAWAIVRRRRGATVSPDQPSVS